MSLETIRTHEININALLHQYGIQSQGGNLYPERIPVNMMERVLDLGCDTGEWIFTLAKRHPKLHIYGVDMDTDVLQQAKIRRNTSSLRQVELRQIDLSQPLLPIPDHYFDLVHMWRGTRFMSNDRWPAMIAECARVLRDGGWLVMTELELGDLSSPACLALHRAGLRAQIGLNRIMDTTGRTYGIAHRLHTMLLQAPFDEVTYDLHILDLGFKGGKAAHHILSEILHQSFLQKPLVMQNGLMSSEQFDALISQAQSELQARELCGWIVSVSVYGRKCKKEDHPQVALREALWHKDKRTR
jgi:SAM-dependent methyltransferase